MILSKKQKKFWLFLVILATLALVTTSMLPFIYSLF